jgi:ribosomal protein S18 acetylase RimI-like enzyme/predicted enzyme related to lactoylglutathione lyase
MQAKPPTIISAKPILAVLVHVPDVAAALSWYERALPGAVRRRILEPEPFDYLEIGGVMLEMVPADEKVTHAAAGSVVYWNTPDFDASLAHLLDVGATLYRGPGDIESGQRMCQVRDPWGNCIGLRGPASRAVSARAQAASCRRATVEDLRAICELGQVVNLLHHQAWPQVFAPASDLARDESHWLQSLLGEASATFVAVEAGLIVGFVTVSVGDENHPLLQPVRFARIGSLCVAERSRGRGIGRALMAEAESWAAGHGATDLRLHVWKFNADALRLYEELGYEVRSLSMGKEAMHEQRQPARGRAGA